MSHASLPTPSRGESCLSDLRIDRLLAGELDAASEKMALAHREGCARCTARSAEIERATKVFRESAPQLNVSVVPLAARRSATRGRTLAVAATALAMAASVALVLRTQSRGSADGDDVRLKGHERIAFYVKRGEHVTLGSSGERVAPGDVLRFAYTAREPRYLAILIVDGAGTASVYYPQGDTAARIEPGENVALDASTKLDTTLGEETIFGLFCAAPFAVEPARRALEATHAAPEIPSCVADRVTLTKLRGP